MIPWRRGTIAALLGGLLTLAVFPATWPGKVVRVIDGDTIVVLRRLPGGASQVRVRLADIDAPEMGQPFGRAAREFCGWACFGQEVAVTERGQDKYGRSIALIYLPDGWCLNRELVKAGFAWNYKQYSTDPSLEKLESLARKAKIGLWADPYPVPPWEWRKSHSK